MPEIVAVDIGGTHVRFALARIEDGRVAGLTDEMVLKTADFAGLQTAWEAFGARLGRPLPREAGLAVACPVGEPVLRLTNNPWVIRPASIPETLGVDRFTIVNDFGAVGHAVSGLGEADFRHLCGPETPLPSQGVIAVVGPGTGLGVAMVSRSPEGVRVLEAEGGHADFSPVDAVDDRILVDLRRSFPRVSIERVVSGPGLAHIHATLAAIEGRAAEPRTDADLWTLALSGRDSLAAAAFDRFCLCLGAAVGNIALTQGAVAVVIAGGLGLRIADHLASSGFERRFRAKGRFESRMAAMPVKVIIHPEPGLFGAAAAFLAARA
jgi:glucokinase